LEVTQESVWVSKVVCLGFCLFLQLESQKPVALICQPHLMKGEELDWLAYFIDGIQGYLPCCGRFAYCLQIRAPFSNVANLWRIKSLSIIVSSVSPAIRFTTLGSIVSTAVGQNILGTSRISGACIARVGTLSVNKFKAT
jgi:hypothetical protein